MKKKKTKKVFSSIREVRDAYFPIYAKKNSLDENRNSEAIGEELASQLSEKFRLALQK
jgi:hypothetical protein